MMSTRVIVPSLCVALLSGCGTKYIAELDPQELASSSDDGGATTTSGADGPGQTVTSGVETTDATTGGPTVECEPDPMAVCGDPPQEVGVTLPPPPPISGPSIPDDNEYDCTVTELDGSEATRRIILDCGLEFPTDVSSSLPDETFAKLALDQAVHVEFIEEEAGNGSTMRLSIDDHPLYIVMSGTTLDPLPGVDAFEPFAVTAETDLCLAPCNDDPNVCYGQDRQRLDFAVDGDPVTEIWASDYDTVTVDGVDYLITVSLAYGAEVVNPDSWACEQPSYSWYSFSIADVSP